MILEPVKQAIGPWNFREISPKQLLGRFNGFLKSIILRVSEARDLGEFDRYAFHDHIKSRITTPPDVTHVDEKYQKSRSSNLPGSSSPQTTRPMEFTRQPMTGGTS